MNQNSFKISTGRTFFVPSVIISIILMVGTFGILFFCPDIFFNKASLNMFDYFNNLTIHTQNSGLFAAGVIFWIFIIFSLVIGLTTLWYGIRLLLTFAFYRDWYPKYIQSCTEIINSCNPDTFKDKVAMLVATCNDFLPNTLLQTSRQTYKNMDVWIVDDSTKPDVIQQIDEFCQKHGFYVLHRDPDHKKQHPTKAGNVFYWLDRYADKYDYVFENDSSSIITSTFVENALCYFHTPLLDQTKTSAIVCNGSFYPSKNIITYLHHNLMQFAESNASVGGSSELLGYAMHLNGWGTMYKTSILRLIPLKEIECPMCDTARGFWLSSHGYHNYYDPFDFSGKFSPKNMDAIKKQKVKWHGGDMFIARSGLAFRKYPIQYGNTFIKMFSLPVCIMLPFAFFSLIVFNVILACVGFVYINWSSIILLILLWLVFIIPYIVIGIIKKMSFKVLLLLIPWAIVEVGLSYRRQLQIIVNGYILNRWSSRAVTIKTSQRATIKQKLRMCRLDAILLLVFTIVCIILQYTVVRTGAMYAANLWINLYLVFIAPFVCYILWIFIGDIPTKTGYVDTMTEFHIEEIDFRFIQYIKHSEIWNKKHKKLN